MSLEGVATKRGRLIAKPEGQRNLHLTFFSDKIYLYTYMVIVQKMVVQVINYSFN